jgi:putative methyltransferase (TIGR04325 family)
MSAQGQFKKYIKWLIPPFIFDLLRLLIKGKYGLGGDYPDWQSALKKCEGYHSPAIFEKVYAASLKVKRGDAPYERDSVLFDKIQYSWPILAGLMWVAAQSGGKLNIVDFGGALGSTYSQNINFLKNLPEVRWNVIEQKHYVAAGQKDFQTEELKFYYSLEEYCADNQPRAIILSGVLQYLEKPYAILEEIQQRDFDFILIDRTPFSEASKDKVVIQKVPPQIFDASYPCWIFSEEKFRNFFKGYKIISDFPGFEGKITEKSRFKGFFIKRQ